MSPHVSQPRRRLPTGDDLRLRRVLAQRGDQRGGGVVRLGHQPPAGDALALLERLEDQRFLLRAHALERADAAVARGLLEVVERPDAEPVIEQRDGLRPDALQAQQVEDGRRKLLQQLLVVAGRCRSRRARAILPARSLPMPGMREALGGGQVRRPASPRCAMVSAALRYARILNGFSPLISSRSPISASTRAMARLSTAAPAGRPAMGVDARLDRQAFGLDAEVEEPGAAARRAPGGSPGRAPARRCRTGSRRRRRRRPCRRRRRPRRRPASIASIAGVVTPGASPLRFSHSSATWRPTAGQSPRSSAARIATAMSRMRAKRSLHVAVAVDVALGDFPVVDAGVARRVGVGEHEALLAARRDRPSSGTRRTPSTPSSTAEMPP